MGGAVVSEHATSADPTGRASRHEGATPRSSAGAEPAAEHALAQGVSPPPDREIRGREEIKRLQTELALTQAWAAITDNNLQWAYEWLRRDVPAFVEHEKKMTARAGLLGRPRRDSRRSRSSAAGQAAATTGRDAVVTARAARCWPGRQRLGGGGPGVRRTAALVQFAGDPERTMIVPIHLLTVNGEQLTPAGLIEVSEAQWPVSDARAGLPGGPGGRAARGRSAGSVGAGSASPQRGWWPSIPTTRSRHREAERRSGGSRTPASLSMPVSSP